MKILSVGDKWWVGHSYVCRNCGTVVELEANDAFEIGINDEPPYGRCGWFRCPHCKHKVFAQEERVPVEIFPQNQPLPKQQ